MEIGCISLVEVGFIEITQKPVIKKRKPLETNGLDKDDDKFLK